MTIAFLSILHILPQTATLLANYVCFSFFFPLCISLQAWLWKWWWMSGSWLIIKGGRWLIRTMCVFLYSVNKIYHSRNAGLGWENDLWCVKNAQRAKGWSPLRHIAMTVPYPTALTWLKDLTLLLLLLLSLSVSLSRFPTYWIYLSQTFRNILKTVLRSSRTNISETSKTIHSKSSKIRFVYFCHWRGSQFANWKYIFKDC